MSQNRVIRPRNYSNVTYRLCVIMIFIGVINTGCGRQFLYRAFHFFEKVGNNLTYAGGIPRISNTLEVKNGGIH